MDSFLDVLVLLFNLYLFLPSVIASCPLPSEPHLPIPRLTPEDFSAIVDNLTALADAQLSQLASSTPAFANVSVSVAITGSDETPLFTYNFGPAGSHVTADSIYRIASVSKVFAVYEALVNAVDLDDKVSKWLPEFGRGEFDTITLRGLAGQVSGLTREYPDNDASVAPLSSHLLPETITPFIELLRQVAPVPDDEKPPCLSKGTVKTYGGARACTAEDYIRLLSSRPLVYPSNAYPSYSNMGFDLLGHVTSLKTEEDYADLIAKDVTRRLKMPHTSLRKPSDSLGVIPTAQAIRTWNEDFGWASPAGAMYSSAADLARFASYILSGLERPSESEDKLGLPPQVLREWLAPRAYTASRSAFVGLPWEDYRPTVEGLNGGFPFTLHTKSGSLFAYFSLLSIIPEYGLGIAVLSSGGSGVETSAITDDIIRRFGAVIEAKRAKSAKDTYAGVYSAEYGNSTAVIELAVADGGLGLDTLRWTIAGLNLLGTLANQAPPGDQGGPAQAAFQANHLFRRQETGANVQASWRYFPTPAAAPDTWRATVFSNASAPAGSILSDACPEWFVTDALYYGNQPTDLIHFVRDDSERVVAVDIPWLRLRLNKES